MKQVKIADIKNVINVTSNNRLASILIDGLMTLEEKAKTKGYDKIAELRNKQWNELYDLLDEVGYFDDCK